MNAQDFEHDARTLQESLDRERYTPPHERARHDIEQRLGAELAPHAAASEPDPPAPPKRYPPPSEEPEERLCIDCGRYFTPANRTGRRPKRCQGCREPVRARAEKAPPPEEPQPAESEPSRIEQWAKRQADAPEPPRSALRPPAVLPWAYSVRVRGVAVRCRTLDDLVAVVERYGEGG